MGGEDDVDACPQPRSKIVSPRSICGEAKVVPDSERTLDGRAGTSASSSGE